MASEDHIHSTLVVGYGVSGGKVVKALLERERRAGRKADIVVVAAESFTPPALKVIYSLLYPESTERAGEANANIEYANFDLVEGVKIVVGKVISLAVEGGGEDGRIAVKLKDGVRVRARKCVLCTGFALPVFKPEVGSTVGEYEQTRAEYREAILSSKGAHVVVAGAGPVGLEVAGVIAQRMEEKHTGGRVTLVTSGDL